MNNDPDYEEKTKLVQNYAFAVLPAPTTTKNDGRNEHDFHF